MFSEEAEDLVSHASFACQQCHAKADPRSREELEGSSGTAAAISPGDAAPVSFQQALFQIPFLSRL